MESILISGSSGLVGTELCDYLTKKNFSVYRLVRGRSPVNDDEIEWDPGDSRFDTYRIPDAAVVINLCGKNIMSGYWTAKRKREIRESRVVSTRVLAEAMANRSTPPRVLISASAVGYYGDRGDEILDEDSPFGQGFLADTCRQWEAAAEPAMASGTRVVFLRFGIILSSRGGALRMMRRPFKLGVGGMLGNGRQYMSWVTLDDVIRIVGHVIDCDELRGPVNVVSPNSVNNRTFTRILGRVLSRPTFCAVPAFLMRAVAREMADEMFLASTRVRPGKLIETNYRFHHADLDLALRDLLKK